MPSETKPTQAEILVELTRLVRWIEPTALTRDDYTALDAACVALVRKDNAAAKLFTSAMDERLANADRIIDGRAMGKIMADTEALPDGLEDEDDPRDSMCHDCGHRHGSRVPCRGEQSRRTAAATYAAMKYEGGVE